MSPEASRGPIQPSEVLELRTQQIPDQVFEGFNILIARNIDRGSATVLQKDIMAMLEEQGMDRREIYEKHWLDVEDSYREAGWRVTYRKPVYYAGEDFDPYFTFSS